MSPSAEQFSRESRLAHISGAVLLGGPSSKMGRDKARLVWAGTALATRAAGLLAAFFEDVMLVGGNAPDDAIGRRVPDLDIGPPSPLRGLVSALEAATSDQVLVLATDLPLVPPDLVIGLAGYPDGPAVVPRSAAGAQPLCARYERKAVLDLARSQLEQNRQTLSDLLHALDVLWLEGSSLEALDPHGAALRHVETPADFELLENQPPEAKRGFWPGWPGAGF